MAARRPVLLLGERRLRQQRPQAGVFRFFLEGASEIATPLFQLDGSLDPGHATDAEQFWETSITSDHYRVTIEGAGHGTMSDVCSLTPDFDGCGEEFLDSEEAFRIMNAYSLAFGEAYLELGDRGDSILDGSFEVGAAADYLTTP